MQPLTARYRWLREQLRLANLAIDRGQDAFDVVNSFYISMISFLDSDPDIAKTNDTRVLGKLAAALYDINQGGRPDFLFDRGAKNPSHPPSNLSFAQMQGACAAAVHLLIEAGETRTDAASHVATLLRKAKLEGRNGKRIDAKQLLRWRSEVGARLPPLGTESFNLRLQTIMAYAPNAFSDVRLAREVVDSIIQALLSQGFGF